MPATEPPLLPGAMPVGDGGAGDDMNALPRRPPACECEPPAAGVPAAGVPQREDVPLAEQAADSVVSVGRAAGGANSTSVAGNQADTNAGSATGGSIAAAAVAEADDP